MGMLFAMNLKILNLNVGGSFDVLVYDHERAR